MLPVPAGGVCSAPSVLCSLRMVAGAAVVIARHVGRGGARASASTPPPGPRIDSWVRRHSIGEAGSLGRFLDRHSWPVVKRIFVQVRQALRTRFFRTGDQSPLLHCQQRARHAHPQIKGGTPSASGRFRRWGGCEEQGLRGAGTEEQGPRSRDGVNQLTLEARVNWLTPSPSSMIGDRCGA